MLVSSEERRGAAAGGGSAVSPTGIVAPVFLLCLAAATAAGNEAQADAAIDAGPVLVVAVLIGAVAARVLHRALQAGGTQPSALRLCVLALPLLAYAGAVVLGGKGFIAAFVAGVVFEPEARQLPADALHLVEDIGALLSLALWFFFGAVLNDVVERGSITWQIVLFAWRCRHRGRYRGVGHGGLRLGRCGSTRTGAPSRPPAVLRPTHRRWAPRTSNAPIRSQSSGCNGQMRVEHGLSSRLAEVGIGLGRRLGTVAGLFQLDDRIAGRGIAVGLSVGLVRLGVELPDNGHEHDGSPLICFRRTQRLGRLDLDLAQSAHNVDHGDAHPLPVVDVVGPARTCATASPMWPFPDISWLPR